MIEASYRNGFATVIVTQRIPDAAEAGTDVLRPVPGLRVPEEITIEQGALAGSGTWQAVARTNGRRQGAWRGGG